MSDRNGASTADALQRGAAAVAPWTLGTSTPEDGRLDVDIAADSLIAAVTALGAVGWGRLVAITGLDRLAPAAPPRAAGRPAARPAGGARAGASTAADASAPERPPDDLLVLYGFAVGAAMLTLRVAVPRTAPTVPTLHAQVPYAGYFERELHEMLGVDVTGAPNLDRLLLADDWPDGVFPLRKDAVLPVAAQQAE